MRTTLIRALRLTLREGRVPARTGALALAVLLTMSVVPALAQSLVKGKVVDAQGKPVEGATITFESQSSSAKRDTKTDKKGEFLQVGLASGAYKVTATKEGVGTATQTGQVSQGRPVELSFKLAPAAAGGPLAGGGDAKAAAELQALAAAAGAASTAGNWDEAVAKYTELTAKVPTCAECFLQLGHAQAQKKSYTEAEAAYKQSLSIRETADAYNGLVRIYNDQKKFDLAAEAGGKAAALSSTAGGGGNPEALYNNGVVLFNAGKFGEAKAQFDAATKADPNMALAHYYLGMANLNGGDLPGATAAFEAYLKLDPEGSKIPASSPVKVNELKAFLASQKK
jgi:Tfp pilus assembly protein PilF